MFSDVVDLLKTTYVPDAIGQEKEVTTEREVFCHRKSVSQKEYFNLAQLSGGKYAMKDKNVFVMNAFDYEGELKLRFEDKVYVIYRSYEHGDTIDLYCEVRNGS